MKHIALAMTLLVLAATLAGCSAREPPPPSSPDPADSDPADSDPAGPAPVEDVPDPRRFWNSTHTLQVAGAAENVAIPFQNCVTAISETDQVISNVTATATWSSVAPTSFYIVYDEGPDGRYALNQSSSSPLSIEMAEVANLDADTGLFWISVEPALGNAAPLTEVQLALYFEHDDELEIWYGGCDSAPLI